MEIVKCLSFSTTESYSGTLLKLGFVASIYYLGRERNLRMFQFRGSNSDVVVHGILEGIRSCLCSWKAVNLLLRP
ncbi:hypothetical protein RHMOL_Rhmol11G0281000 [Rhododendron molle]|uniref:Uncharacterized protein n=1 Tax=Rhododendron molle TaxID=49168 RepID=A0ACC0LXC2_RHOML|nr:hypothetical protein RHMOL_Rhmol11G0281000 [Rhododendron molle]